MAARLGLTAIIMTACGTNGYLSPPGSYTTLMAGWEHHFTLEWAAKLESGGARQVSGYLYNHHGEAAQNVRLLTQALDPAGKAVAQRIETVPGGVNGFGRVYFAVAPVPAAAKYTVTVWDYTWLQTDDKPPDRRGRSPRAAELVTAMIDENRALRLGTHQREARDSEGGVRRASLVFSLSLVASATTLDA